MKNSPEGLSVRRWVEITLPEGETTFVNEREYALLTALEARNGNMTSSKILAEEIGITDYDVHASFRSLKIKLSKSERIVFHSRTTRGIGVSVLDGTGALATGQTIPPESF